MPLSLTPTARPNNHPSHAAAPSANRTICYRALRHPIFATALLLVVSACQRRDPDIDVRQSALTASGNEVTGFEAAGDWTVTQGNIPAPVLSTQHTQGSESLAVKAAGYVFLTSRSFSVSADITGPFSLDLLLPVQQANQYWFGAVQIYVTCPSKSIFNSFLAEDELTGLTTNVFHSLSFPLSAAVATTLKGGCPDLSIGIAVNVATNEAGTYLVDNLRFGGSGSRVVPILNCVATFDGLTYTAFFGYQNLENQIVTIPPGSTNAFSPLPANVGQPTVFQPGTIATAISIMFPAAQTRTWTLTAGSASATSRSAVCPNSSAQRVTCIDAQRQSVNGCVRFVSLPTVKGANQDPAVLGQPFDPSTLPAAPDGGEEDEGDTESTQWLLPLKTIEFLPSQTQTFTVNATGLGAVRASAKWSTAGTLTLSMTVAGIVTNGNLTPLGNQGGSVTATTFTKTATSAQISLQNTGATAIPAVRVAIGFTPAQ